jgi:hypothetical protein
MWSFPGMQAHEIAQEVGVVRAETGLQLMPHPKMRHAIVGDLRSLGCVVEPGGGPRGHVRLKFKQAPDEHAWPAFDAAFSHPVDNPITLRTSR